MFRVSWCDVVCWRVLCLMLCVVVCCCCVVALLVVVHCCVGVCGVVRCSVWLFVNWCWWVT